MAFGSYEEGEDQEDMDIHAMSEEEKGDAEAYDTQGYEYNGEVEDETDVSIEELLEGFHKAGLGRGSEYDEVYDSDEEAEEFGVEDSELS